VVGLGQALAGLFRPFDGGVVKVGDIDDVPDFVPPEGQVAGKHVGDQTEFTGPNLLNVTIQPLPAATP
jgi:hypothetical protein